VVLYQGYVDLSRGIGRFVLALAELPVEYRVVVVGGGPDVERLREMGRPFENAGRFAMLGQVAHRLLPAITALADVGIVTYPFHGLNNVYCAPNKVFEYAQAGVPIVATDQPPLRRLVGGYGIGELVSERQDAGELAAVIQKVVENKAEFTKALPRFLQDHRWEDEATRVRAALSGILSDQRGAA
jgi:glycosyltransferase involved in cell wall biosynthesis